MRDYSLTADEGKRAVAAGLSTAEWYKPDLPRKRMKELMQRSDRRAILDTVVWLGLLIAFGVVGALTWFSWLSVVSLLLYGVLYGSASDSRWHECGHGTAFRTRWMNSVVYQLACFMIMRDPVVWRWSHTRHHTDTVIVGRDPEVLFTRPPKFVSLVANLVGLPDVAHALPNMVQHSAGRLTPSERLFVPDTEHHKVYRTARIWIVIYAAVVAVCVATRSIVPAVLVGLPRLYGCWHMVMCGMLQHGGMAEDVLDHRLNTRSVYLNPISRFIYWNMNYHVEHHLFPMVPYHALPALHEELKSAVPVPTTGIAAGFAELVPALLRQRNDHSYSIPRQLPDGTLLSPPSVRVPDRS